MLVIKNIDRDTFSIDDGSGARTVGKPWVAYSETSDTVTLKSNHYGFKYVGSIDTITVNDKSYSDAIDCAIDINKFTIPILASIDGGGGGLTSVAVDGTTIIGDGTSGNPLSAIGGGDGIPQLVLETFVPLPPLNSISIIFGFNGDTTSIITASCNEGITFNAGIYNSGSNITTYTANFSLDILDSGVSVTPIFTIQENGVEMPIWSKSYSPLDFGLNPSIYTDGTTITGDGTEESPLVAHYTIPTSVQNLLVENQLEVANRLVVDGSIVDVNGDQYPTAGLTQIKLTAGDNITIDYTQPKQPVISATGGGSGGTTVEYTASTGELYIDGVQVRNLSLGLGAIKADTVTTTSIVEGIGGILAGSFLQNEDGEDYILQKDVEAGYVKKTDLVVDSTPTENSINLVTSGGVYEFTTTQAIIPFGTHRTTDTWRWQFQYDEIYKSIVRDAYSRGLAPDDDNTAVVSIPYTVTTDTGGIIQVTMRNTATDVTQIAINGEVVYDATGLPAGIPVTISFEVAVNDVISDTNGSDGMTFTPYVVDYSSPIMKMYTDSLTQIAEVNKQVLDINAKLANKILSGTQTDIEAATQAGGYTVSNALGGRITGKGVGAVLVSTGTVDVTSAVTGQTNRVYNNLAPLTLFAPAPTLVADVGDGDVIVSSGMAELFFEPYIAG